MSSRRAKAGGETIGGQFFKGGQYNPSDAILAARGRRAGKNVKIDWFIDEVCGKVRMTMQQRVKIATDLLRDVVVRNIGEPVTKSIGPRGGRVVTNRSKPGEFPKADTVQLKKTIFGHVTKHSGGAEGFVGTPLSYGLILETRMNRSFLKRTMEEQRARVVRILSGPMK